MLYKINNDYSGRMQITTTAYDHKPTSEECRKMVFTSTSVSLDALSDFISDGYSYCPTDKKKDNVKESDFICIDVDGSDLDMDTFVSNITDTPSIHYTTPSDGDEEVALKKHGDRSRKYRFRLIYALSSPTKDAADYEKGYRYIVAANGLDRIAGFDDVVDFRVANQFYNGSRGCVIHNTHRVYSLPDEYRDVVPERKKKGSSPKPKQPKGGVRSDKIHSGTTLEADVRSEFLNCTKYEDYLEWYNGMFGESNLLRETPYLPDEEDERKLVCGDCYVIPKKYVGWDKVNKTKIYGKWLDGENRHTKIYITGIILRKLNPTASADDLLREIVAILMTYYNIFDPDRSLKFTPKNILQLLDSVMKADLTKELKEIKHPSFKVSSSYCERNRVNQNDITMNNLERWYSEFQTIVPAPEQNVNQSEATFYCLQGVSFLIDKMVNVGFKDLLGIGADKVNEQAKETCWCDLDELCRRHPELRRSNVVSRQWRLENGFPAKGGYKCRQTYYEPDVIEWIDRHLRGKGNC